MNKPKILVQLDGDSHASVFDAVVAVDAGVEQLLQYQQVEPTEVQGLVHGAIFTRGPQDLHHTAIFVGGSNVATGEVLLKQVTASFFGPMRVSVMLDSSGANTTAVAAVLAAARHVSLPECRAVVLAGTGPVGQRVARLLAGQGANVSLGSRSFARAQQVSRAIAAAVPDGRLRPVQTENSQEVAAALDGASLVIAAGAAGIRLLPQSTRQQASSLQVAIDLNAVPPLGIEGTEVTDKAVERDGVICYGAIGVGGTKMKIHKRAIAQLFEKNDQVLDAEQILALGQALESEAS